VTSPLPPEMQIDAPSQSPFRNLSLIWVVPILALLLSFGVAWKTYSDRGTLITIVFPDAEGIIPGETVVKLRDVVIGSVEDVRFGADFNTVIVHARIDNDLAPTLPTDAEFWIVRPEVSARGISGLSTVLSGVYLEGAWIPIKNSAIVAFSGLPDAPIVRPGRAGARIILRSTEGSLLPEGGPVFFRGVEVGRIDKPRVSDNGRTATVEAFINAPHDRFITTATRFWDMSGFSVSIGPGGLDLSVASIGSLLSGGVAFDNAFTGGKPLSINTVFDLYVDEDSARGSIFTEVGENALAMAVIFTGSVNGLASGAPVEYRGLRVGRVTGINAFIDRMPSGDRVVRLRTALVIDPQALGLGAETGQDELLLFLQDAVTQGMRARLTTSSIFSAALKIELAEMPDETPAAIIIEEDGTPILPNIDSDLPDFTATAEGVLDRINRLPIEELMTQAVTLMASIEEVVGSEGVRQTPEALVALLEDGRAFINQDDTQALPGELRGAVAELRQVVADLQTQGAVEKLTSILESADKAAASFATTSEEFPALVADLRELAAKAKLIKTDELVASTTALLDSANAFIGTDAARALPADLSQTLEEVSAALKELREGGTVSNMNAALSSAADAAQAVATAADDLPKLTAKLEALVARADGLVGAYGKGSAFSKETMDLLRELQATAKSVTQLARTIERNPNSLLIGR
jgi:paraquat-inducible protein B